MRASAWFFFAAFALILLQAARVLSPFFPAILGATVLALTIHPLHARLERRLGGRAGLAAAATTAAVLLTVVVPLAVFGLVFAREAAEVAPAVKAWLAGLDDGPLGDGPLADWRARAVDLAVGHAGELGGDIARAAGRALRNGALLALNGAAMTLSLFFFLRDGPSLVERGLALIPMAEAHKRAILERLEETVFAVLQGVLAVAAIQGTMAGIGFALLGVPFPAVLGAAAVLAAPVPIVGTGAVFAPVVLALAAAGRFSQAAAVAVWGIAVVGLIDNFLRPLLISRQTRTPYLLLFFGLLGGLKAYGFTGLLLGPLVIALSLAFVKIYREDYLGSGARGEEVINKLIAR